MKLLWGELGRPRTITDEQVEQVNTKTLEGPPPR
jgi:hypothetical protein